MYFSQWEMRNVPRTHRQGKKTWLGGPAHSSPRPSMEKSERGMKTVAQLSKPWSNSSPGGGGGGGMGNLSKQCCYRGGINVT